MRPPHSVKAHYYIARELVRLTLGLRGPERPELLAPVLDDKTQTRRVRRTKRGKR